MNAITRTADMAAGRALGLASLGVALTELAAPRKVEQWLGIRNGQHTGILRVLGVREALHGFDILSHRDPTPGVWARVAGDVLDTALLGLAARKTRNLKGFATVAAIVMAIGVLDMVFAKRLSKHEIES